MIKEQTPVVSSERRQDVNSQALILLMKDLTDSVMELKREVKSVSSSFQYHHATYVEATEKAVEAAVSKGFPDGDPEGHRKHHELVTKAAEKRAEFWSMMSKEIAKYGLISLIGFVALWVWQGFLKGPMK
jgi:flagellar biosynthesis/type III secretory pathway protein FliH